MCCLMRAGGESEAGGKPTLFPQKSTYGRSHLIEVVPDSRVKVTLILLAPALAWLREKVH